MNIEKYILAVVTTNPKRVPSGATVFVCDNKEDMDNYAVNLEAILDGIAHAITDEVYIIVKH
ncbi:hypothetical protein R4Z09_07915 [Niallia oryzisoli]|uniref:Uncharacterized protein n=1 Tax=Niallia oryzisoli TaxID=1737571 RepID=A0ABZ2CGH4_9BACI